MVSPEETDNILREILQDNTVTEPEGKHPQTKAKQMIKVQRLKMGELQIQNCTRKLFQRVTISNKMEKDAEVHLQGTTRLSKPCPKSAM